MVLLAAGQGDEGAKEYVTTLENAMSREQIAEGQKLARNFTPRELPSERSDSSSAGMAQTRPESSGTGFFIAFGMNRHLPTRARERRVMASLCYFCSTFARFLTVPR